MKSLPSDFWEILKNDHPKTFDHFSKWIDQYKKENDWDALFYNGNIDKPGPFGQELSYKRDIKFHDLPIDMQNGIIARYELFVTGKTDAYYVWMITLEQQLYDFFRENEKRLNENDNPEKENDRQGS